MALDARFAAHPGAEVLWGTGDHAGITYLQRYAQDGRSLYTAYVGSLCGDRLTLAEAEGCVSLSFGARRARAFAVLERALEAALQPVSLRPNRLGGADCRLEN